MIIKSACGVLETFMELSFSVGMFVELCGREKLRGEAGEGAGGNGIDRVHCNSTSNEYQVAAMSAGCAISYYAIIMPESLHIDTGRMASGDIMECLCEWYDIDAASAGRINLCSGISSEL